jgi:hypothetical protein
MASKKHINEENFGCGESLFYCLIIFILIWGGLTFINVKIEKINFINSVNKDVFGNNPKFVNNVLNENYDPILELEEDEQESIDSENEESLKSAPKGSIICYFCDGRGIIDFCKWCSNGYVHCPKCKGDGVEYGSGKVCLQCHGNGLTLCSNCNGDPSSFRDVCSTCKGEKYIEMITCPNCKGKELNENDEDYDWGGKGTKCENCRGDGIVEKRWY